MRLIQTALNDAFILEPEIWKDSRGYFFESYNKDTFQSVTGLLVDFVQDNQARSNRGVLRGLHYQTGNSAQAKLVSVIAGSVLDVIVDLRVSSASFGNHISVLLSAENKRQLFIPRGFAHGYIVMEDNTEFFYKCDNFYNKDAEAGIIYNDAALAIDWQLDNIEFIVSDKDNLLPTFKNSVYF